MSGRLREIGRQTVEIAESGHYTSPAGTRISIAEAVGAAIAGTRHYLPDTPLPEPAPRPSPAPADEAGTGQPLERPAVTVTRESTLGAAARFGPDVACLVFASAKNPGGGFLGGAKAQEEDIARASALYPCLRSAPEFYEFHRNQQDLRYSDRVIYSPGVPVFRDERGHLLDRPFRSAFLTSAAPNLGAIVRNQPADAADVPGVLGRRAERVLRIAAAHGHRRLVLGAWGCGVFRNDPGTVARAFAEALRVVDRFDEVVFAIYDKMPGTPVHAAFDEVMRGWRDRPGSPG
ncbi:TIGR02452 family protein [Micromonospora sp. NBC_01796]|uniref:TIGR02452 family protein n=1 Tax=Micromonospora sp. NBC_01796 TaxID=2975987 RepID=UPI002DDC2C91|nr:TIGR02452 family protein [Micromonospora sp. NBC_01796]WSA82831.1 TIGR02452 family protein [Micromonospora sp. NBC_01796]